MKKHLMRLAIFTLIFSIFLQCAPAISAAQEGEYERNLSQSVTATVGEKTLHAITDPVVFWEVASGGSLSDYQIKFNSVSEDATVIYTPWYPNTKTGRAGSYVEYVCKLDSENQYVVTEIVTAGDGNTYIPVGGFVISVHTSQDNGFAAVGDVVALGGAKITIPTKAVESDEKRIVIDYTNTNRSGPMIVYYDYQFGEKTGTNPFGSEVICQYDFEEKAFKVIDFRPFGTGDDSGSTIPDNGFVLSSYGPGYRQLLSPDQLFFKGDKVRMVGFDYIRFGGTVVGEYDYINPTKEGNPGSMETPTEEFAAYRGENQTMIYKDGWSYKGAAGTGTNVYGYEAAVDANGVVVELGVNVSKIPEGGYVISGHGKGRDFIRANVVLGATVVLNEKTQTYSVSTTLNSYYENLVTDVEAVITAAETRMKQLYDVDTAALTSYIEDVRAELVSLKKVKEDIEIALEDPNLTEDGRVSLLMSYNNSQLKIEKLRQQILVSSAESKAVSARAVWHRPIENTYEEIEANIRMYQEIGINLIFVETLYNGYSAFKSDVEEFPYHKNLALTYTKGGTDPVVYNDYLSAFVALCKEYGIEVHAWVENFYVGIDPLAKVVTMHPDWIMYNDDGTYLQRNEGGLYIFIDPANKAVQNTLISYYNDLFDKNPDVAGLNLDYIRYPVSSREEDTGFTIESMKGFYEGVMGKSFTANQSSTREKMYNKFTQLFDKQYLLGGQEEADANYQKWVDYRMGLITGYVKRIKTEIKDERGIILSTSVFASLQESTNAKKQDWQTWYLNGWIDLATPMAYYTNSTDVLKRVNDMILMGGNNCLYYTGIASSYSGLPAWQNKEHIEASYQAGASGYVIFCSTQIIGHEDVQNALKSGVNSKWAVLPHAPIADLLAATKADLASKADRIYIPAGGMTAEQKAALVAAIEEIEDMSAETAVDIYKILKKVETLAKSGVKDMAKGYSRQRIAEQLNELVEILDARISMELIADGEWNPEEIRVRPIVTENGIIFQGDHVCESKCDTCGKCLDKTCTMDACKEKCQGHKTETPKGDENKEFDTKGAIIVAIVAGVVLIGTGVALAIVFTKKKKPQKKKETKEEPEQN
ncbi:MAG: family 10 glycosylhydrolase [Clostridia bacterium]|nr:family 10 glycosylhydrolase [Clostridia bacterium]